jgi:hypothetical protein
VRAIVLSIVLVLGSCLSVARAEPSIALVDLAARPEPDWREQDLALLESVREALAAQPGVRSVPGEDVATFFREKPETAAEPLMKRARGHLDRGMALSARLKPRQAIQEFSAALRILRAIFPHLDDLAGLQEAHLQMGMTYQALGQSRKADQQYRMVLLQDPDRTLDEATVNPVVVERFDRVRQQVLTSLKGSFSLISTPAGARVYMNGNHLGYTPLTVPGIYPGEHYFSLEHDGYKTWSGILRIRPGGMEKREVFLVEGKGIRWLRLRNRMAQAGIGRARPADAQKLATALGTDWLLLASVSHLGGKTMLEVGLFEAGSGTVDSLGIFPVEGGGLTRLAERVRRWVQGDRRTPSKTFVRRKDPPVREVVGRKDPPPPPPPPPPDGDTRWYESWWFWTAVGVVAAGAVTTTTVLLVSRESGIRVEVFR